MVWLGLEGICVYVTGMVRSIIMQQFLSDAVVIILFLVEILVFILFYPAIVFLIIVLAYLLVRNILASDQLKKLNEIISFSVRSMFFLPWGLSYMWKETSWPYQIKRVWTIILISPVLLTIIVAVILFVISTL